LISRRIVGSVAIAVALLSVSAYAVGAAPLQWDEQTDGGGDAGDLPGTAQELANATKIGGITGHLPGESGVTTDVDMYAFCSNGGRFSATVKSVFGDSSLYLFTDGESHVEAVAHAEDRSSTNYDAKLVTSLDPGHYYLAVTAYDIHPQDVSDVNLFTATNDDSSSRYYQTYQGTWGPQSSALVDHWVSTGSDGGSYSVRLGGAVVCPN